jgi:hypothetical protein
MNTPSWSLLRKTQRELLAALRHPTPLTYKDTLRFLVVRLLPRWLSKALWESNIVLGKWSAPVFGRMIDRDAHRISRILEKNK